MGTVEWMEIGKISEWWWEGEVGDESRVLGCLEKWNNKAPVRPWEDFGIHWSIQWKFIEFQSGHTICCGIKGLDVKTIFFFSKWDAEI